MHSPIVVCADIGSAKKNFGWWSTAGGEGRKPLELVQHVAKLLNEGKPVALGFECPLFVPLPLDQNELGKARPEEKDRPWSAGAGCAVLTTGLAQVAWIMQEIYKAVDGPKQAFLDWPTFAEADSGLLIWEAFVSKAAKLDDHIDDARAGAHAFRRALPDPVSAIKCTSPVYSLVGAALLRTGWSTDVNVLQQSCLVIKAKDAPVETAQP